jgi:hypothetical protein
MTAITEYKLISADEGVTRGQSPLPSNTDWRLYPGDRRGDGVVSCGPPAGSLLLKTGGNALQAIDRDILDKQNMVSVVAPDGKYPGDIILVTCPFVPGRLISTAIPKGALPGHSFLVRAPPIPEIVTGVPVELRSEKDSTQVVNGYDIIAAAAEHELALREEHAQRTTQTSGTHTTAQEDDFEMVEGAAARDRRNSDEEFEMVQNSRRDQSTTNTGNGWVGAYFVGKHFLS